MIGKTMSFKTFGNDGLKYRQAKIIDKYFHERLDTYVYIGRTEIGNEVRLTIDEIENIY